MKKVLSGWLTGSGKEVDVFACFKHAMPRKPYAKPTVTRQPFEHLIDLECRQNPNM